MEEENKKRKKEYIYIYMKYNSLYKPSNDLAFKPLSINSNNLEKRQSRLKTELNKQIEVMRRKKLAIDHLAKYPLN